MPWRPNEPGERPTLGHDVIDWITENLAAPDRAEYEPFILTDEQALFVLRFYEIDPVTEKRLIRRGVISRPRGWGKSPFLAAIAAAEALAEVVPAGWNAAGRPVGMPWSEVRTPVVQVAAVSEEQTKNSWTPLLEMLRDGPIADTPGLEVMETFVNLPRGRIETITSSAHTVKGNRAVFAVLDQTEEWTRSNGGHRLYSVMRSNSAKLGGSTIESPNAYTPGMDSVAEQTANAYALKIEGKTQDNEGILYDHREAPADTDLRDRVSMLKGLGFSYGDSASIRPRGWVDLDRLFAESRDTDMDPQQVRSDFLNQITYASDAWLSQPEWKARSAPEITVLPDEDVVLGFDGSRRRSRGITDATALIGCRVKDGHVFVVEVWEQPDNVDDWAVPTTAVDASVREAIDKYRVVAMFADPALWESYIAEWEAAFGSKLLVKSSREHPIEWRANHGKAVAATGEMHSAIVDGEMTHDGSSILTRHALNARRRNKGVIGKEYPDSPRKIDAAMAMVIAWQARLEALAKGYGTERGDGPNRVILL